MNLLFSHHLVIYLYLSKNCIVWEIPTPAEGACLP